MAYAPVVGLYQADRELFFISGIKYNYIVVLQTCKSLSQ